MSHYFFYLVHSTISNYNWVTRILAHTLGGNFESFCEVNPVFEHFVLFFSIPRHTKGNPSGRAKLYRCILHRANPLLPLKFIQFYCRIWIWFKVHSKASQVLVQWLLGKHCQISAFLLIKLCEGNNPVYKDPFSCTSCNCFARYMFSKLLTNIKHMFCEL